MLLPLLLCSAFVGLSNGPKELWILFFKGMPWYSQFVLCGVPDGGGYHFWRLSFGFFSFFRHCPPSFAPQSSFVCGHTVYVLCSCLLYLCQNIWQFAVSVSDGENGSVSESSTYIFQFVKFLYDYLFMNMEPHRFNIPKPSRNIQTTTTLPYAEQKSFSAVYSQSNFGLFDPMPFSRALSLLKEVKYFTRCISRTARLRETHAHSAFSERWNNERREWRSEKRSVCVCASVFA